MAVTRTRWAVAAALSAVVLVAAPSAAAVQTAVPSTVQTSVTFTGTPAEIQAVLDAVNGTTTVDPTPTPTTTTAARPEHYNSGNSSELVTEIPVATSSSLAVKQVIFSIPIGDVSTGDLIEVLAEFECTNDLGFNAFMASQVILADSPTAVTGQEITEANGFNITANMHHGTSTRMGTLEVPAPATARYVNVVAYSSSTLATPTSTLRVEQDYGRLSVLIWR